MLNQTTFAPRLIEWYRRHGRDLPWRHTRDPYRIWLSEVILQQTRVRQGMPYYHAFVEKFPTVNDLAAASEQEVLRLWQGLGYYSRARNLHETARIVAQKHNGVFPGNYAGLLALKGVGPYTAAAIASFAFGEQVAVLDGNVYRVLARLLGIETDIATPKAKTEFTRAAAALVPANEPDTYNQAIMEFGAIQCTPVAPDCLLCPFQAECVAYDTGRQHELPVKSKKAPVKNRFFHYIVLQFNGGVAMKQRPAGDIWQGLYDFLLVEQTGRESIASPDELLVLPAVAALGVPADVSLEPEVYTHVLTHQRIEARFWRLEYTTPPALPASVQLYTAAQAHDLPKPVLIDKYLSKHFF